MFRIGIGYDIHAFSSETAEYVMLGGVKVPFNRKISAHSDGDVVLHAITDALLGAIAEGSIGVHFSNQDDRWRGASSNDFVTYAFNLVKRKGYKIGNVDLTVICQEPKIMPHALKIRQNIAELLAIEIDQVNTKAVTAEELGAIGRKEGIAAQVAILIIKG